MTPAKNELITFGVNPYLGNWRGAAKDVTIKMGE
jgi:hypothetical protein